jgi:hypothetical protein
MTIMVAHLPTDRNDDVVIGGLTPSEAAEMTQMRLSAESKMRKAEQDRKRGQYFLKGPLSFDVIQQTIPDAASRVVLVAMAFMDMGQSNECVISKKIWDCAGVRTPDQRRRVLARLRRQTTALQVIDRPGRPSVLIVHT